MSIAAMPRKAPRSPCLCAAPPARRGSYACRLCRTAITPVEPAKGNCRMSTFRFTRDHEWIRLEGDLAVVGITDYAQSQLGDVVYVELPEIGRWVEKGKEAAVVESVKAASEVYAPVSGEVAEVNEAIAADPAKVNADPLGDGWFIKLRLADPKELDGLLDEDAYKRFVEEQR